MSKTYVVKYKTYSHSQTKSLDVVASSKENAYDKATYILIPSIEGTIPYSAWVDSCTFNNGNRKTFNTFEGKPL